MSVTFRVNAIRFGEDQDYAQVILGERGEKGEKGDPGSTYTLTDRDKSEIATRVDAELVNTGAYAIPEIVNSINGASGLISRPMYINGSNKWDGTNGNESHVILIVQPGDTVYLKANSSTATYYAVLTDDKGVKGNTPAYSTASGWTTRKILSVNSTVTITIPADGKYLAINRTASNGNSYFPVAVQVNGSDVTVGVRKQIANISNSLSSAQYLGMGDSITDNSIDLNNYRGVGKEGIYNIGASVKPGNCPGSTGWRTLIVLVQKGAAITRQILINFQVMEFYMRTYTSNKWYDWEKIENDVETVLASDLGRNPYRKAIDHGGIWTDKYENSPKAFVESAKLGIHYHNIDVVFSSDRVPFVFHDDSATDAVDGGIFRFSQLTAAEIKTHKLGDSTYSWTPQTLAEMNRIIQGVGGCIDMVDVSDAANETSASKVSDAKALAAYYHSNHMHVEWTNFDDDASRNAFIADAPSYGVYMVCSGDTAEAKLQTQLSYIRNHPDTKFCINTGYNNVRSFIGNYLAQLNTLGVTLYAGVFNGLDFTNYSEIAWADGILSERYNANYQDYKVFVNSNGY